VLTEVKAYSSWHSAPTLPLVDGGRAETDLIQIRNIDGLDPVKASVNTSPYGSVDGASHTGSSVLTRNIVLTVHPNPDWVAWSFESLRRLLYSYFMPKRATKLEFFSDDMIPVEIAGIVEDVTVNQFSKDPELLVSVICPDPYFIALEPTVITGQTVRSDGASIPIDYDGTIETGIHLRVSSVEAPDPTVIGIQIGQPPVTDLDVDAEVSSASYFEMSSIAMRKFVQNVNIADGVITNRLSKVRPGSEWPILQPGVNEVMIITDQGTQDWELTYFERFGGL
jgi:Phage tail protein